MEVDMETGGGTDLELERCLSLYPNLQKKDLEEIQNSIDTPTLYDSLFHSLAKSRNISKSQEKLFGKIGFLAGPLFQVFKIDIHPLGEQQRPLHIHGQIFNEGGLFYDRHIDNMEIIVQQGGSLTLITPSPTIGSYHPPLFLSSDSLSIKLCDGGQTFIDEILTLDFSTNEFEDFKIKSIVRNGIMLSVNYMAIPMAVYACMQLRFFNKRYLRKSLETIDSFDVYGKVSAKYINTFGNYASQEIVLFEKRPGEYQHVGVDVDPFNDLLASKCWLAVPSYSTLEISVHLFDYRTGKSLISDSVQLEVTSFEGSFKHFPCGDLLIVLEALWHPPTPQGGFEYDSPQVWKLKKHTSLVPSPALQVFSLLIGREQLKTVNIFGTVEYVIDDGEDTSSTFFKRDANTSYQLVQSKTSIPVFHGFEFEEDSGFKITCNLQDIGHCYNVKGYFDFRSDIFESTYFRDKFLCSIIKGERGFLAVHYMVLSSAVRATFEVVHKVHTMEPCDVPFVYGSLSAQFSGFDYSTKYDESCHAIQLFDRVADPVRVDEGLIPLQNSSFLVPTSSGLSIDVDLFIGTQRFFETFQVAIGEKIRIIGKEDAHLSIKLEWSNVSDGMCCI